MTKGLESSFIKRGAMTDILLDPTDRDSAQSESVPVSGLPRRPSLLQQFWRRCRKNAATFTALMYIVGLLVVIAFGPWLAPFDPVHQDLLNASEPPTGVHWFGTDYAGRDIFSRVIYGSRLSTAIGLFAVVLGVLVGVTLGLVSGYFGGLIDDVLMRMIDVLLAFPGILLAILVVSILGSSLLNVIVALAIFSIPTFARLTRGTVLSIRNQEYVTAAYALGASTGRIILRHILPNTLAPVIVYATLRTATAILGGATLSFLGLGVAPPTPEWGLMVSQGRHYILSSPHIILFPGLAIFCTVLSLNLLGDALRDVIDPKSRMH